MTENEHERDENIEDLDVPAEDAEDVKGGLNFSKIDVSAGSQKVKLGDGSVSKISPSQFKQGF